MPSNIDADLLNAAAYGDTETVKRLIDNGANVRATDAYGSTPLHLAAWGGRTDNAQALLQAGAKVNALDSMGRTPLHEAATPLHVAYCHTETVQALLQAGANVNARTNRQQTFLHLAISSCSPSSKDYIKMLLSYRPNLNLRDENNVSAWEAINANPIAREAYHEYLQDNRKTASFLLSWKDPASDPYCLPEEEMALQVLIFSRPSYYKLPSSGLRGVTHDLSTLRLTN